MANKETRIFKSNTFEEFRQKTNDVSLYLGDNEQLNVSLSDKTFNYDNVSAGTTILTGLDVLNKTQQFNIKTEQTIDNTGGYIILTGSPSITGFVPDATITQTGGYTATIVSVTSDKILVKNSSGSFDSSSNISVGSDTILAANVVRIIAEAYHVGVVRVYINGTEINQDMNAGGFHVPNYKGTIPLLNSPSLSGFTVGSTIYQGASLAAATFSGTVLSISSTELRLKNHTGSFSPTTQIKVDGSGSTISGANHSALTNIDDTFGNAIELNTPASANDDIKVYSPSIVDAVNELQDDVGITENLTTVSGNLVGAVNEIEAVFDASTHEISAGSNSFDVTSGEFTIDSSADIVLDADGGNVELKDAGVQYGSLTNTSGNVIVKSGTTTMLTGAGASATFAEDVTVTRDVDIDRNLNVDGTTELNSTLGVDGNFRVGSSNSSKFDVAASTGNTQIDGTLEVDGTAGIDGDLRVGTNKFNVTASSGNTQIDGTLEVDGTAGVDGNFRVGSSGGDKFNVTAASGNTQIDGTLNVDSTTTLNGTTIDGNLDLNGSVDVSTNATIHGVLDVSGTSNLDVVDIDGAVDMALTLQVDGNTTIDGVLDIGTLNAKFTNTNNVKLALNELHDELGNAVITGSGTPAAGQSNITNAVNSIDAEIGSTGYIGSTITFALDAAQDYIGTYSNTVSSTITGALNQLHTEIGTSSLVDNLPADFVYNVTDHTTATNTMSSFIGSTSIANIGTTDTVTGALQKLHAEIGDSNLSVFTATDVSGALRELETEKVYLTSSSQQEIDSKLGLTGNVTFKDGGNNRDTMTFNSGTTLDLSNASLLLPGNASNVNIFSTSFLEVDGNVQIQGFSVDRQHVTTITDKADVRLQWNENHADGTSTTKPARSWQFVGLDDAAASHTTDIVTFYNAKELITNNTESGINVTWDSTSETFDFNVNDPVISFTGDVTGSGTLTNLGNLSIGLTIQPNSVALGTDTTGDYVRRVSGTTNQITVSPPAHSESKDATLSIPTDFRMPGTAKVLGTTGSSSATTGALTVAGGVGIGEDLYIAGNLYVEGTRTELNVTTLEVEDTLILAGNNLSSEPSSGGFGIETGPITNPSGVASNVTGAHSIVYNYATDRWEADGSLILSNATNTPPSVEGVDFAAGSNLTFSAGSGLSESVSGFAVTYTNTDKGSSQAIFKNFTAGTGGTATANINNDTINFPDGSQIRTVRNGDTITINHADTSTLNGTYGQPGTEDGTYIKSVTVDSNGHMTGVTSDDFDDRYDNYGSWQLYLNNVLQENISSGERLGFDEGPGIDLSNDGNDITISHQDTSSVANINNSNNTFIQDLTFDTFGHVTGHTSGTVSIGDGTTTVTHTSSGISITGDNTWSANQTGGSTFNIAHADTSSVGAFNSDNSGNTVIQDLALTFDTFGHVTGISSTAATITTVTNSALVDVDQANGNTNYQVGFFPTNSSGYSKPYIDTDNSHFVYNPSSTLLSGINVDWSDIINEPTLDNYSYWRLYVNGGHVDDIGSGEILDFNAGNAGISLSYTSSENVVITNNMHTNNTLIKDDSRNTRGVTRLYRRDDNSDFSVQTNWNGTYWQLEGYQGDSYHAPVRVEKAEVADSVAYGNVTGTPTIGNGSHTITENSPYMTVSNSGGTFTANDTGNTTDTITLNATTASTASTIVARDASGDISTRLFRSEYDTTNASVGYIMTQVDTASNNYIRPSTAAQIRSFLNVENGSTADQDCFKSIPIYSPGPTHQGTATADSTADTFSMFSGAGITLSTSGDNVTITNTITNNNQLTNGRGFITSYVNTTYSAGAGLDLSGTSFSLEPDLRGNASLIGYGNSDYIQFNQYTTDFRFSGNIEFQMQSDGDFHADGDIIAFSTSTASDAKLKTNIKTVEHALDKVCALDGVTFDWIKDGKESAGVIAQNVEEVLPRAVKEVKDLNGDDTHKSVEYNQLSALFIEAIKELREENKLIRAELENLKSINT
jgi:hypothetical protein